MRQMIVRLLHGGIVLALCLATGFYCLKRLSGDLGLIEVADDEVAVIYNQLNGSTREAQGPGNELFVPLFERIYLQGRSPRQLLLSGSERTPQGVVPEVRIRAADGSLVRFSALTVRYALRGNAARLSLEDSGGHKGTSAALVEAHTRDIFRDEYGRFSAEEILSRDNQNAANALALQRLESALAPHGIVVLELSAPKLRFDSAYENSVEDRKLAYQEIERLKAEFRQLDAERDQRLAALEKQKLVESNATRIQIREYMETIDRSGREKTAKARQDAEDKRAAARNRQYQSEQEALALNAKVSLQAEVLREQIEPLAQTGGALAREAWIKSLNQTPFRLQPYSHDPRPQAVELTETALAGH